MFNADIRLDNGEIMGKYPHFQNLPGVLYKCYDANKLQMVRPSSWVLLETAHGTMLGSLDAPETSTVGIGCQSESQHYPAREPMEYIAANLQFQLQGCVADEGNESSTASARHLQ
ncbi:hypothetical protein Hypma_009352 [Hypsizygus marmoreus]|uniref:Uncharacterized protein n=1 Tax=Hypsizygus marmoreus TaxID=39966 RepID=A0A369JUS5_HYPMA|nr:hypothetical protein Hypma_009352 [Hypsizygus marmoreus]